MKRSKIPMNTMVPDGNGKASDATRGNGSITHQMYSAMIFSVQSERSRLMRSAS